MCLNFGVTGSAGGDAAEEVMIKVTRLGPAVVERGRLLVTGGCPDLHCGTRRAAN